MTAIATSGSTSVERGELRVPWLVVSRIIDQGALGVASLVLARMLGPVAFAPVAVLLVVNSLAIQASDLGLGFAILRSRAGARLDAGALRRVRTVGVATAAAASAAGVVVGGDGGAALTAGGMVWALSAESYIRKAAFIRTRAVRRVAAAEVGGALAVVAGTAVGVATGSIAIVAATIALKHLVEVVLLSPWPSPFAASGARPDSMPDWLSQLATYAAANVDYVVVAATMSAAALSTYVVAFRLASVVPALLAQPITQKAFVELADTGPTTRQARYDKLLRHAALLGVVGAGAALVAAPGIAPLLGSEWSSAAWVAASLALAVPARMLLGTTVAMALVSGARHTLVKWETARLVLIGSAVFVAAAIFGEVWWCAAATAIATIASVIAEHRLAGRLAGVRVPNLLVASVAAVAGTIAVALTAAAVA